MKNKKAFTLIELVSVLVILAILALIVTPLVLNIIKKARTAADKRSIDAYGRSIELAIADYLLENGTFPTSIDQLTIEYSGDRVICSTTQLNSDSSIYLAECTVNSRAVTDYTYGKEDVVTYEAYSVGDEVTYNNVDYYVIKNSDASEANITLLKAEPLTVSEVNQYGGVGTANNHVNMYTTSNISSDYYQKAYNQNGYGKMAYYTSEICGDINGNWISDGCTTDYDSSEVKYVVDVWKTSKAPLAREARLITFDEAISFGYSNEITVGCGGNCNYYQKTEQVQDWLYNSNYDYWTMSQYDDSSIFVWIVSNDGNLKYNPFGATIINNAGTVRPVIVLSKSAL